MNANSVRNHFNKYASTYDYWKNKAWVYHDEVKLLYKENVSPNKQVLEIGCGTGDILASVNPKIGVGVDISGEMIKLARRRHSELVFKKQDASDLNLKQKFDYIILSDVIDYLPDIYNTMKKVAEVCKRNSRVIISTTNPLWEPVLKLAEKIGQKMPDGPRNWLPHQDLINILELSGFRVEKANFRVLLPKHIPIFSNLLNRSIENLGLLRHFGVIQYFVLKKIPPTHTANLSCSVIIPAFNEQDNLEACVHRIPKIAQETEVIIVNDGSTDKTEEVAKQLAKKHRRVRQITYYPNRGKVWAVKEGFDSAKGDVIMILDADMAVPPEELIYFYQLLAKNIADFINGTRMVYPMENQAMRYLNLWGNRVFSAIFSWILTQRVTDTLCGTKALLKKDYLKIKMGTEPWGDFDLLFGAAKQKLKIAEFPVHYKRRVAGESKMRTIQHGFMLLKMCLIGIYKLKLS